MDKIKAILFYTVLLFLVSCNTKRNQVESPLATVVKLISAESAADFEEAIKYIDVDKVYANHPDTMSAYQGWKNKVVFYYNLGQDKKFTGNFPYYDYLIKEELREENAEVIFQAIDQKEDISKITYKLKRHKGAWIVIKIDYGK